ncbi:Glycine--tRNA ligase [Lacipirellula limnantheis]|uniref:Glycine--tRNA ligase n=2 Tax=Lacipirellula limnantheis TaxID=2528024 RepID=A0A517U2X2_9BACT|nr:Glycine--tRNA ligase [Lacipirellula limnantheis]
MDMDKLVSLCKRRGFLFQSSEIYGGLNGFWDYGPLGVELKRNIKEAWWQDMVRGHDELSTPAGAPEAYEMTGLDCTIIMHPQVWKVSGHYDLFCDMMVDCKETKKRYRFDQLRGRWVVAKGKRVFITTLAEAEQETEDLEKRALKAFNLRGKDAASLSWEEKSMSLDQVDDLANVFAPEAKEIGTLTEPREFNLMFKTIVGAMGTEEDAAFLRPETAQGIFVNFKNVLDSTRVKVPFGIAQIGKSFRNEITPRNFTFRSREFEQMEIEFFCHPNASRKWYEYWRDRRMKWYTDLGLAGERLVMREHAADELSHYSVGTADIEYAFPFLPEGEFGELEGIAHRGDFDLRSHMEGKLVKNAEGCLEVEMIPVEGKPDKLRPKHRGSGRDLTYRDEVTNEKFVPHVIEPSSGADRATLAFLCEAYHEDQAPDENGELQTRVVMRFHPRIAPIKAAVFPLVKKDGLPEIAQEIYRKLKAKFSAFYDEKGAVGRRYRRQDEAGTPYCITVDGQTLTDGTVTIRDRDTLEQWRVKVADVVEEISKRVM